MDTKLGADTKFEVDKDIGADTTSEIHYNRRRHGIRDRQEGRTRKSTIQTKRQRCNDEIQTRKIYRPGRDEDAMTRYRPERYTDQEEMETSNDEI